MDADLQKTCDLFIKNRDLLKDTFRWEGSAMHLIGSAVLTAHDLYPDISSLTACAGVIKENSGMLSPLRGHLKILMICNMLLSSDYREYYKNVDRAYNLIRITRRFRDQRYYLASIAMANAVTDKEELLGLVDKAGDIYNRLKEVSGFTDDGTGFVTASIIAATGIESVEDYFAEVESCLDNLEEEFGRNVHTISLCCILALDKANAGFKCARLREIYRALDAEGIKYGKGSDLPVLGSLTMLDMTNAEIAGALREADSFLRTQPGFDRFGCGPDKRHMYAVLLVMCTYASVVYSEQAAEASVVNGAVMSQFMAMGAGTMMVTTAVYDALSSELQI